MRNLRICLYQGSWPQNIGNAFFDFGLEAVLRQAFPNAEFIRTGGAVHWMFNNSNFLRRKFIGRIIRRMFPNFHFNNGNSVEIGELLDVDILVFAGMSMSEEFVKNNGRTFLEANKKGIAILGIGTGGSRYDAREVEVFSNFFKQLKNAALITRDDLTYNSYKNKIKNIAPGIDCAFFLPDYFSRPKFNQNGFDVLTFDYMSPPKYLVMSEKRKYFAHHDLWGYLPRKYVRHYQTLVSDVPEDYLSLYSNCDTTYSDRVHACIASLAYGNAAQLYSETPRKELFKKLNLGEITLRPVKLDQNLIGLLKSEQILKTREIVLGLTSNE